MAPQAPALPVADPFGEVVGARRGARGRVDEPHEPAAGRLAVDEALLDQHLANFVRSQHAERGPDFRNVTIPELSTNFCHHINRFIDCLVGLPLGVRAMQMAMPGDGVCIAIYPHNDGRYRPGQGAAEAVAAGYSGAVSPPMTCEALRGAPDDHTVAGLQAHKDLMQRVADIASDLYAARGA